MGSSSLELSDSMDSTTLPNSLDIGFRTLLHLRYLKTYYILTHPCFTGV